jgi:hypothetical protein
MYNRRSTKVITPASDGAEKVVSISEMKAWLRLDTTTDDEMIRDLIDVATEQVKQHLQRGLLNETLELILDWPTGSAIDDLDRLGDGEHNTTRQAANGHANEIDLPFPPVQSITSIKTTDTTNVQTTFSSSNYQLDTHGGRVFLNQGHTWPSDLRDRAAVVIRYVSGYGASPKAIPAAIKQAIRQHVAYMYECRQSCEIQPSCKDLLAPYRLHDMLGWV